MKKFYLIAMAVLTVSLWSCSKSEPAENPYADAPWAIDETLPVPIQFGASDPFYIETKGAPVTDLTSLTDASLHIFAGQLKKNEENKWEIDTAEGVLFADANATVATVDGEDIVQFVDENGATVKKFYPMVQKGETRYNYSFRGYKIPSKTSAGTTETLKVFSVRPDTKNGVDYNVDVLWGGGEKADATDITVEEDGEDVTYKGFNAQYLRKARSKYGSPGWKTYRPGLVFDHKLSLIHLVVTTDGTPDTALGETYVDAENNPLFKVKNLGVAVRWYVAQLDILNGELLPHEPDAPSNTNNFLTYNSFAAYTEDYGVAVDPSEAAGVEYGTGVFVIPGVRPVDEEVFKEDRRVWIQFDLEGPEGTNTYKAPLALPEGNSYVAGTQYNYYIKVKPTMGVTISTSLNAWTDGVIAAEDQTAVEIG